jgi:DNA-binding MarR family transcriptional regulator
MTAMQFYLLMEIQIALGTAPSVLAGRAGLDPTTLSRSLALLERNGWVESAAAADRRLKQFQLTKKGAAVVKRAFLKWQAAVGTFDAGACGTAIESEQT